MFEIKKKIFQQEESLDQYKNLSNVIINVLTFV